MLGHISFEIASIARALQNETRSHIIDDIRRTKPGLIDGINDNGVEVTINGNVFPPFRNTNQSQGGLLNPKGAGLKAIGDVLRNVTP